MKLLHLIYVLVVLFCIPNVSYAQVSTRDSLALVALYDSTDGANWTDNTNWLTGPVSTWYGITVVDSNVTRIEFSNNNLSGHLPPQMGDLDSLEWLRLFRNDFLVGEIPPEIGNLKKLEYLLLNNNKFTGEIPKEIGNMDNLRLINLDQSDLTGAIPVEITNCLKLEVFRVSNNELDSIPDLSGLPLLRELDISGNQFSGPLPEFFYSLTNLTLCWVSSNQFDGELSPDIANLQLLRNFYFENNNFTGTIPKEIGTMNAVTFLQLYGNDFSGEIPTELGDMDNLQYLRLHNNQLTGEIPEHLANLSGLRHLNLGSNQLTGTIPDSIGYLTSLTGLYLSNNKLEGPLPQTFENLVNLEDIYLSNNNFTGTLDGVFNNAHSAERIYIEGNNFEGAIPDSFVSFTSLTHLYIGRINDGNNFSELPSFENHPTLNFFDIRNNSFTFEDIEPQLANTNLSGFFYSPQDSVGEATDTTVAIGSSLTLDVMVGGTSNEYQWMKDDVDISGANSSTYAISSFSESDSGSYNCRITNTLATDLILYSRPVRVNSSGTTSVKDNFDALPREYALYQNYPNPFNPASVIVYDIPKDGMVMLQVYNLIGEVVSVLVNEEKPAGSYEIEFDASRLASGIYFYSIQAGTFVDTKKMLLLK